MLLSDAEDGSAVAVGDRALVLPETGASGCCSAGGGGHTRYQQMVLQNMEWPLEVLKGCGAFEVFVLQMAALCSAVTQQLCQPPLQRSADADWLFWKHSALFCIKNLRKQTKEHVAWAQVQVRVL